MVRCHPPWAWQELHAPCVSMFACTCVPTAYRELSVMQSVYAPAHDARKQLAAAGAALRSFRKGWEGRESWVSPYFGWRAPFFLVKTVGGRRSWMRCASVR